MSFLHFHLLSWVNFPTCVCCWILAMLWYLNCQNELVLVLNSLSNSGFTYCKALQIAKNVKIPTNASACNCKEACVDPQTCACAKLNGFDFPYVRMSRQVGRCVIHQLLTECKIRLKNGRKLCILYSENVKYLYKYYNLLERK